MKDIVESRSSDQTSDRTLTFDLCVVSWLLVCCRRGEFRRDSLRDSRRE